MVKSQEQRYNAVTEDGEVIESFHCKNSARSAKPELESKTFQKIKIVKIKNEQ